MHSYHTEVKDLVIFVTAMEMRSKLAQNLSFWSSYFYLSETVEKGRKNGWVARVEEFGQ